MLVDRLRLFPLLRFMWPQIFGFTLWSACVVVLHTLGHYPERFGVEAGLLTELSDWLAWTSVGIPFSAIAALGGALAIFLGFRNNSAYDRWWEGRKIWGALVNDSRSWARQVIAWCGTGRGRAEPPGIELRRELIHRHLAFVHALVHHLRGEPVLLREAVGRFLSSDEAKAVGATPNALTALLIQQGRRVAQARDAEQIEHFRHLAMDEMLTRLSDIQGRCERIKNTPLPRQYDAFPRWFAFIYGTLLPFGLVEPIGWGTVPISVVITWIFLCLEASGRVIENPFTTHPAALPLTSLSLVIERDLRAALAEPVPDAAQPVNGILL